MASVTSAITTTAISDNINNNISHVVSEAERRQYLQHLQDDTTITMIPAMCFLLLLAVTGVVGNCLVLFVYSRKLRWTPTTIFIMVIAAFDLVTNLIAIPGEIYDMFHIWDFDNPPLCRARLFFSGFTVLSSGMALLAVAVVRYRKVCTPHGWQITKSQAKIISVTIMCLAVLFSTPTAVVNGRQTKETPRPDISGYECTTDDSYKDTIWPVLNTVFFLILFVSCCVPLTALYIKIGIKAWKHSRIYGGSNASITTTKTTLGSTSASETELSRQKNTVTAAVVGHTGAVQTSPGGTTSDELVTSNSDGQPWKKTGKTKLSKKKNSSVDFGSIADLMDQYKEELEIENGTDQYSVRFLEDKVEIHTPLTGDFVVMLKSSTSSGRNLIEQDQRELFDQPADRGVNNSNETVESGQVVDLDDRENETISPTAAQEEMNTKEKESESHQGDRPEDSSINCAQVIGSGENEMPCESPEVDNSVETVQQVQNEKSEQNDSRSEDTVNPNCPINDDSSQNVSESAEIHVVQNCQNTSEGLKIYSGQTLEHLNDTENEIRTSGNIEIMTSGLPVSGGQEAEGSEQNSSPSENQTNCGDRDLRSALRWVDIVYCPDEAQAKDDGVNAGDSTKDIEKSKHKSDTAPSSRNSPSSNHLSKKDWFKALIAEVITRNKLGNISPEWKQEAEGDSNTEIVLKEIENTNSCNEKEIVSCPGQAETGQTNSEKVKKDSLKNVKKIFARGKSVLKSGSQRSSSRGSRRSMGKTTAMLIIISAIFAIGFLPHLALMFYKFASPGQFAAMTMVELSFYNLFLRSYFLNSAANPIIYSLCDAKFRRECWTALRCC